METLGKFVNSVSDVLEFNKATLSGCVDVVVVRQPDGSLKSSAFHVRFGKLKILKSKNKTVEILVNSEKTQLEMKLGEAGEGFFEEESLVTSKNESNFINGNFRHKKEEQLEVAKSSNQTNKVDPIKLLSVLELKSSSSIASCKTRAESETYESQKDLNAEMLNQESNDQKACDLIFLDELELPTLTKTLMPSVKTTKQHTSHLSHEQANPISNSKAQDIQKTKFRTLRPSSAQLESLNLRQGVNTITYIVKSKLQGIQKVTGFIYLWSYDANIIVSDIDGTITKSDVIGHLMSMVGKDWSQPGIAPLYNNIRRNGYHLLYLTSRAIGQAQQTREFVDSVYQDGKMLPHGPLLTSPDQMIPSIKREIVFKRPELFKMAVLKDIRNLFPKGHNPFHAGFGNRETDAIAYKSVGIPLEKVFIVNQDGHIHHHGHHATKSYAVINTMLKELFPGIIKNKKAKLANKINNENFLNLEDSRLMQANVIKVIS